MIQSIAHRCAELLGQNSGLIELGRPAYETALNFVSWGRGISWSINGMPCRIDARFRSSMGQRYDPEVAALLRQAVRPGSLCFDVGANLGVYVLQFAHWSKPDGTVVAFEPNPLAARALRRHIDMNNLTGRVLVVDQALSDAEGHLNSLRPVGTV
jgi:hypothetical protein